MFTESSSQFHLFLNSSNIPSSCQGKFEFLLNSFQFTPYGLKKDFWYFLINFVVHGTDGFELRPFQGETIYSMVFFSAFFQKGDKVSINFSDHLIYRLAHKNSQGSILAFWIKNSSVQRFSPFTSERFLSTIFGCNISSWVQVIPLLKVRAWKFQNCSYFVIKSYDQGNDGLELWMNPLNLSGNAFKKEIDQGSEGLADNVSQFNLSANFSIKDWSHILTEFEDKYPHLISPLNFTICSFESG